MADDDALRAALADALSRDEDARARGERELTALARSARGPAALLRVVCDASAGADARTLAGVTFKRRCGARAFASGMSASARREARNALLDAAMPGGDAGDEERDAGCRGEDRAMVRADE